MGNAPVSVYAEASAWDYIPGYDSPESYAAFATYRDLGPRLRTYARVAEMHMRSMQTIVRWAQGWGWAERVQAFDVAQNAARDALLAERRTAADAAWAERRAQHLEMAERALSLGQAALIRKLESGRDLKTNELTQLLREVMRWQNLANGDPTERLDTEQDLSQLTAEELAKLTEARAILDKGKEQ
jgi:hypothetical protein